MGSALKKITIDLESKATYQSSMIIDKKLSFSAQSNEETVTLGFSTAQGTSKTVISKEMILNMSQYQSVGITYLNKDINYVSVCYKISGSQQVPF